MNLRSAYLDGYELWAKRVCKRFWSKVEKREPNECWLWKGSVNKKGYGEIKIGYPASGRGSRKIPATWLSLLVSGEDLPDGLIAMHTCDTPACVNPAHLVIGTHLQNMKDKVEKDRTAKLKGSQNPIAKLNEEKVREIRSLYAAGGYSHKKLAKMFGVTYGMIGFITRREAWKHI